MDSGVWWFFLVRKIILGTNVATMSSLPYPRLKLKDDNYPNKPKAECFRIKLVFFRFILWIINLSWVLLLCPVSLGLNFIWIFSLCCFHWFWVLSSLEQSLKPESAYFIIKIRMNLIWFSFFNFCFCFFFTNKMYSFEMEILFAHRPEQRWNIFLLIHIFIVGWKKWFNIFQRNNVEYTKEAGRMWLFQMKFSKNNFHSRPSRTFSYTFSLFAFISGMGRKNWHIEKGNLRKKILAKDKQHNYRVKM